MGRHAADRSGVGEERNAQAFDRPAFERLVEPHRAALRAYALRLAEGDEAVADSIVEETLHRAAQEPEQFRRPSAVRPWLVLTARNVVRDASAGPSRSPRLPSTRQPATTIVAALQHLPAVHRELVVELFYEGVSLEEAAAARSVPVETIRFRLYFAMRALHAVLA